MNPFDLNLARAYSAPGAFCPRPDVTEILRRAHAAKLWTLLDADRRIGKSSSAIVNSVQAGWPILHVDLMGVMTEQSVDEAFRWGWDVFRQHDSLGFFSNIKPEISAKVPLIPVTVKMAAEATPAPTNWGDVIMHFDRRSRENGGILFIDELQDLRNLSNNGSTTARKLRARLQTCRHLTPVLAGSSQSLLSPIFATAASPFYKSIRIQKHIGPLDQDIFNRWVDSIFAQQSRSFERAAVERLYQLTDGVTEDIVAACAELWIQDARGRAITPSDVEITWRNVVANAVSLFVPAIASLSPAQARLIRYIARNPHIQPFAAQTLRDLKESRSTVDRALRKLLELQLVREKATDGRKRVWVHDARVAYYLSG